MWTWTCGTIWFAARPLFWPILRPSAFTVFEIVFAIKETMQYSLPTSASDIWRMSSKCFFGITKVCPKVKGYLSKNARNEEFSYTSEAFKTPETIEQKIQEFVFISSCKNTTVIHDLIF